jgi:hypothetical protein
MPMPFRLLLSLPAFEMLSASDDVSSSLSDLLTGDEAAAPSASPSSAFEVNQGTWVYIPSAPISTPIAKSACQQIGSYSSCKVNPQCGTWNGYTCSFHSTTPTQPPLNPVPPPAKPTSHCTNLNDIECANSDRCTLHNQGKPTRSCVPS